MYLCCAKELIQRNLRPQMDNFFNTQLSISLELNAVLVSYLQKFISCHSNSLLILLVVNVDGLFYCQALT